MAFESDSNGDPTRLGKDECESRTEVKEAVCREGKIEKHTLFCNSGSCCADGACSVEGCLPTPTPTPTTKCEDRDGENPDALNAAVEYNGQEYKRVYDECADSSTVLEAICIGHEAVHIPMSCASHKCCESGQCTERDCPTPTPTPTPTATPTKVGCCICQYQTNSNEVRFSEACDTWLAGSECQGFNKTKQGVDPQWKYNLETDPPTACWTLPPIPSVNGCEPYYYQYNGHGSASTGPQCIEMIMESCVDTGQFPEVKCILNSCSTVQKMSEIEEQLKRMQEQHPTLNWVVSGSPQISYSDLWTGEESPNQPRATFKIYPTGYKFDLTECSDLLGKECQVESKGSDVPKCHDSSACPAQIIAMQCCRECKNDYMGPGTYWGVYKKLSEACEPPHCRKVCGGGILGLGDSCNGLQVSDRDDECTTWGAACGW